MKKMKVIICLLMCLCLVGCGSKTKDDVSKQTEKTTEEKETVDTEQKEQTEQSKNETVKNDDSKTNDKKDTSSSSKNSNTTKKETTKTNSSKSTATSSTIDDKKTSSNSASSSKPSSNSTSSQTTEKKEEPKKEEPKKEEPKKEETKPTFAMTPAEMKAYAKQCILATNFKYTDDPIGNGMTGWNSPTQVSTSMTAEKIKNRIKGSVESTADGLNREQFATLGCVIDFDTSSGKYFVKIYY